jgi:hypothetical protein
MVWFSLFIFFFERVSGLLIVPDVVHSLSSTHFRKGTRILYRPMVFINVMYWNVRFVIVLCGKRTRYT